LRVACFWSQAHKKFDPFSLYLTTPFTRLGYVALNDMITNDSQEDVKGSSCDPF
jgi:hypothetical protein